MTKSATLTMAALLLAVVLVISACDSESDVLGTGRSGVTGTVVDRDKSVRPVGFKLVIDNGQGERTRLFVRRSVYRKCPKDAAYPACAEGP